MQQILIQHWEQLLNHWWAIPSPNRSFVLRIFLKWLVKIMWSVITCSAEFSSMQMYWKRLKNKREWFIFVLIKSCIVLSDLMLFFLLNQLTEFIDKKRTPCQWFTSTQWCPLSYVLRQKIYHQNYNKWRCSRNAQHPEEIPSGNMLNTIRVWDLFLDIIMSIFFF